MAVPVKIDAVCAGMREYAVTDDVNPLSHGLGTEYFKIFICSENWVNPGIIGGIISMVGS